MLEITTLPKHGKQHAYSCLQDVFNEWMAARNKFPAFNSPHEGFAVLLEEVEELKTEVFKGGSEPRSAARMREEATQVAAMALWFLTDCCAEGGS